MIDLRGATVLTQILAGRDVEQRRLPKEPAWWQRTYIRMLFAADVVICLLTVVAVATLSPDSKAGTPGWLLLIGYSPVWLTLLSLCRV